jgi:steroid delta-isomerase-like uncharacterized protein
VAAQVDTYEIAERYLRAANAHDIDAMVALWTPGSRETFPAFGQTFRVPDEFAAHFRALFDSIPDVSWKITSITADTEGAVVRSTMTGTHVGEYQGLSGTGRRFEVETADFLQIAGSRIVHNDVLFDGLAVLRELGVLPPQGSKRERAMQATFNALTRARRRLSSRRG